MAPPPRAPSVERSLHLGHSPQDLINCASRDNALHLFKRHHVDVATIDCLRCAAAAANSTAVCIDSASMRPRISPAAKASLVPIRPTASVTG
jgi:hypothetical protein